MASLLTESVYELLGTFVFFLAIFVTGKNYIIAIALFLAIVIFGAYSGHFNLTVSILKLADGAISVQQFAGYLVGQLLGGGMALMVSKAMASATAAAAAATVAL